MEAMFSFEGFWTISNKQSTLLPEQTFQTRNGICLFLRNSRLKTVIYPLNGVTDLISPKVSHCRSTTHQKQKNCLERVAKMLRSCFCHMARNGENKVTWNHSLENNFQMTLIFLYHRRKCYSGPFSLSFGLLPVLKCFRNIYIHNLPGFCFHTI